MKPANMKKTDSLFMEEETKHNNILNQSDNIVELEPNVIANNVLTSLCLQPKTESINLHDQCS